MSVCSRTQKGNKMEDVKRNRRLKLLTGLIFFLSFVSLVFLLAFDSRNVPTEQKPTKTKRCAKLNDNDVSMHRSLHRKSLARAENDVQLLPENPNRRINHHPNHRYAAMESESKLYEKMIRDVYAENGWSPQPFEMKTREPPNSIQSIIFEGETDDGWPKDTKSVAPEEKVKDLGSAVRLRGVYVMPNADVDEVTDQDIDNTESSFNLKQINALAQNSMRESDGREGWPVKKKMRIHGLPFKLPSRGPELLHRYRGSYSNNNKYWTKPDAVKNSKKSVTIFLDVYPMREDQVGERFPLKMMPVKGNEIFGNVVSPSMIFPVKMPPFNSGKNRMVMKLNFHPKKIKVNTNLPLREDFHLQNNKVVERRTFKWFPKNKKDRQKECVVVVVGLKPYIKPTKTKWKDEEGHFRYGNHVRIIVLDESDGKYSKH